MSPVVPAARHIHIRLPEAMVLQHFRARWETVNRAAGVFEQYHGKPPYLAGPAALAARARANETLFILQELFPALHLMGVLCDTENHAFDMTLEFGTDTALIAAKLTLAEYLADPPKDFYEGVDDNIPF